MEKCKVCEDKTEVVFNIDFKAIPICENCASSIFLQQAKWYTEGQGQKLPIHDVVGLSEQLLFSPEDIERIVGKRSTHNAKYIRSLFEK